MYSECLDSQFGQCLFLETQAQVQNNIVSLFTYVPAVVHNIYI